MNESFLDCYGWALHWYNKDRNYERAYNVLAEISERFKSSLKMFENIFGGSFEKNPEMEKYRDKNVSCFPEYSREEVPDHHQPLNIDYNKFKLYDLNWQNLGELTLKLYNHIVENDNVSVVYFIETVYANMKFSISRIYVHFSILMTFCHK